MAKFVLFVLSLLFHYARNVQGGPLKSTDSYAAGCSPVSLSKTPLLWSKASTWPSGVIPGVGSAKGVDVTIPCGKSVLLDVPSVKLGTLLVQGLLTFKDDSRLPLIYVQANFVIVEGQFYIGTEAKQFSQKVLIELTPRRDRSPYSYSLTPPADKENPRDLGYKAFVVIGGQVSLHGLPGSSSMPVWCKLSKTAKAGDKAISVDCDVSQWPKGAEIAVASTDFDRKQTETFFVKSVRGSTIRLESAVKNKHIGDARAIPDGFGGFIDQRAEVALLSRNIQIQGLQEGAPYDLEGGHFMIYMTNKARQQIEGVVFQNMGQQGTLGRYPIHFHILGDVPGTICRKNTVRNSNQRCVVVHASHSITIEQNVAFNTSGHCFMTEEGGEHSNKFLGNLGMLTKPVKKVIQPKGANPPLETDASPATFWMTNALNILVGNVAAGSSDTGFWYEMVRTVRAASLNIPEIQGTVPFITAPSRGSFRNNVAHSCGMTGMRTYPFGMRPRKLPDYSDSRPGFIEGFNAYKNGVYGMFIHNTDLVVIRNCTFSDNVWGLHLNQDARISVENSRFVGVSANSASSCPSVPTFGFIVDQGRSIDLAQSIYPNYMRKLKFSGYPSSCSNVAAIALMGEEVGDFWNPSHNIQKVKFAKGSRQIWLAPQKSKLVSFTMSDGGEQAQFYTLFDKDGSLVGSKGYVVANNKAILPPSQRGCSFKKDWNAYACSGTCYRTVMIAYPEDGFTRSYNNIRNQPGSFSSIRISRLSDGQELNLQGNLQSGNFPDPVRRYYFATLLAGQEYKVQIVPPSGRSFSPKSLRVAYADSGECGGSITLRFAHPSGQSWAVPQTASSDFKLCAGAESLSASFSNAQLQNICSNGKPWLQISLGSVFSATLKIMQGTDGPISCPTQSICSLLWSGSSNWLYDASGEDRSSKFYSNSVSSFWKSGVAPLGKQNYNSGTLVTNLPGPSGSLTTYYFRRTFSLSHKECLKSLILSVVVNDGVVLYLNGVEVYRSNLPRKKISATTYAPTRKPFMNWEKQIILPLSGSVPYALRNGQNFIAAEQHTVQYGTEVSFDLRISAVQSASCSS